MPGRRNNNNGRRVRPPPRGFVPHRLTIPHEIKVSGNPPPIKNYVQIQRVKQLVGTLSSTPTNVLVNELATGLAAESLRITSIKVWLTSDSSGSGSTLVVIISDPTNAEILAQLTDVGTYSSSASVGYAYGDRIASTPVSKTSTDQLCQISSPTSGGYIVHVHYMALSPNF